jgi:hypothetical protein
LLSVIIAGSAVQIKRSRLSRASLLQLLVADTRTRGKLVSEQPATRHNIIDVPRLRDYLLFIRLGYVYVPCIYVYIYRFACSTDDQIESNFLSLFIIYVIFLSGFSC